MGCVRKMRGFVMLMAAVSLFAASVSACACPTHAHAKPKREKTSCHSQSDQDATVASNGLAAHDICSCGDSIESPAITPKSEKHISPLETGAGPAASAARSRGPGFRSFEVTGHRPAELSGYDRLRFANLPSRAPPRRIS
jgi:hypothetical protein